MAVQKIRVSREQLSEFLTDPRAIKQFEQLFDEVNSASTSSEDTVITAALASTTANLALDTALRAASDAQADLSAPPIDQAAITHQITEAVAQANQAPLLDTADLVRRYGPETVPGDKDFTGSSTSTTPAVDNNTTRIATTAFVLGQASGSLPVVNGVATIGTSYRYSRQDHIHPTDGTLVPSTRTINTTAPLTGGGDLSADRTFAMAAATASVNGYMTLAYAGKLDGIAAGAQVNVLEGVTGTAPIVAGAIAAKSQAISINAATTLLPGSMSAADKVKLDQFIPTALKTWTVTNSLTISGTDGSTLNIGAGGTLGTAAFTAASAYEPALGNPGVNGYVLSSTTLGVRSWVGAASGTVTSVAALTLGTTGTDLSSTVANPTTTPVITLQVPTASAANRGALSAADWTTFNSKLTSALTSGFIFVGNVSNVATGVAVTGDAAMSNAGVLGVNKTRLNVRNETGVTIASTRAVYVNGFNNLPLILLADNTDEAKHNVVGITIAPIAHQADGFIATTGQCDAETNGWVVGTELYVSTAGVLTSTEPTSGEVRHAAIVTVQANYPAGKLLVYGGLESAVRGVGVGSGITDRLGDSIGATAWSVCNYTNTAVANITSLGALTALTVAKTGGTAAQFLKADGTVDSTLYTALPTTTAVASATITAGQWVNFHNVAGVKNVRPADSTDATKPAQGFALVGFASAATGTVYLYGVNTVIPVGAYAAADVGKPVFLSTAGGTTLTPPATTGNLLQQVGWVDAVGATVTVNFINSPGIVRA